MFASQTSYFLSSPIFNLQDLLSNFQISNFQLLTLELPISLDKLFTLQFFFNILQR